MIEIPNDDDVSPSDIEREAALSEADLTFAKLLHADLPDGVQDSDTE